MQAQPFLENLAHAARGLAEPARRNTGGAVEGSNEIGEIAKPDVNYLVNWGGHTEHYVDDSGAERIRWVPKQVIKGVAYDTPIQGYDVHTCNVMTLWSARAAMSSAWSAALDALIRTLP